MAEIAFVTGAGSGMGRLAARRWADAGMQVAAVDVNDRGLEETAQGNQNISTHHCDVTDLDQVEQIARSVEADLGPITRLLNAAAIARVGRLLDQDPHELKLLMDVNYLGTAAVCGAIVPGMLRHGRGEVINFASLAGWIPQVKLGAYCATKFALVAYTEALWMENRGRGVQFHCVCPPAVDTPMLPDFFADAGKRKKAMAITPESVIDEIEKAVDKNAFLVIPSLVGKGLWRARRHAPGLLRRAVLTKRLDLVED